LVLCRLESAQGAEQDLVLLQQAAEVAELQQEAVRVARELDAQQLLALLQQQQLAAQQEQVRTRPQGTPGQVQGLRQHACSRLACAGTCGHAAVCWTPTSTQNLDPKIGACINHILAAQANANTLQVQAVAHTLLDSTFAHLKDMAAVLAQAHIRRRSASSSGGTRGPSPHQQHAGAQPQERSRQLQQQQQQHKQEGSGAAEPAWQSPDCDATTWREQEQQQQQQDLAMAYTSFDYGSLYTDGLNERWSSDAQALPPEFQLRRSSFSGPGAGEPLMPVPHFQAMLDAEAADGVAAGAAAAQQQPAAAAAQEAGAAAGVESILAVDVAQAAAADWQRVSRWSGAQAVEVTAAVAGATGSASSIISEELGDGALSDAGSSAGDVIPEDSELLQQQHQHAYVSGESVVAEDSAAAATAGDSRTPVQQQQKRYWGQGPAATAAAAATNGSRAASVAEEEYWQGSGGVAQYAYSVTSSSQQYGSDFESESTSQQRAASVQEEQCKQVLLLHQQQQQRQAGAAAVEVNTEKLQQQVGQQVQPSGPVTVST
jgi:hypothetical protein